MTDSRFERAVSEFRRINAQDPNHRDVGGHLEPRELVDSDRLVHWVKHLCPQASEALLLAAHCQHLRRWEIPRTEFPEGRVGYLRWRKQLARYHADEAAKVLSDVGYDELTIDQVRCIILKRDLHSSADSQTMEDALCLVFLEHELAEFADKHPPQKTVEILRKTWRKMSETGHREALRLEYVPKVKALIEQALSTRSGRSP